jgi:hypothetical protein
MMRKVSAGQKLDIPASTWNDMIDAVNDFKLRRQLGSPSSFSQHGIYSSIIKVKNSSGDGRRGGDLLQIDTTLVTTLDRQHLWFNGVVPAAPLWQTMHGILVRQTPNGEIGDCFVNGVCLAYVNVTNAGHYRCDAKASQYTLESCFAGPWQILYKPSGTGEKLCVVVIGQKRPSSGVAKLAGALAAGSTSTATSASATMQRRNKSTSALESAAQTITVWSYYATAFATNDYLNVSQDEDGDWWMTTKDCS